jgi:AcrR family transcriptional regulator
MAQTHERDAAPAVEPAVQPTGQPTRHRGRLSRALIVRTALRLMDEEGLDAVTMRRVGRELGVEAMSLYNHVHDKEDLLDGVVQAVMAEFRFDPSPDEDWLTQGRAAAHEWRRLLKLHPNVMTLLVERKHPLTDASALRPMEVALGVLRRAGLSERDTVHAFQATGGYIFGFVMMEIGNVAPGRPGSLDDLPADLSKLADAFPMFAQMMPWLMECDMDATFEFGLDLLFEGIRAKAAG